MKTANVYKGNVGDYNVLDGIKNGKRSTPNSWENK